MQYIGAENKTTQTKSSKTKKNPADARKNALQLMQFLLHY